MGWMAVMGAVSSMASNFTNKGGSSNGQDISNLKDLENKALLIHQRRDTGFYKHLKVSGRKQSKSGFYKHSKKVGNTLF